MKTSLHSLICILFTYIFCFLPLQAEEPPSLVELAPCAITSSKTETLVSRIDVGLQPLQIALNSQTKKIYVTNFANDTVSVLDSESNTLLTTITVGKGPNGISVNENTNKIYVANQIDNTVTIIDGLNDTTTTQVSVGQRPVHVSLNKNTNKIYIANQDSNTVSVIDGITNTIINEITVGTKPQGIGINTKSNKIYVANTESNNITVIDGSSNTVIKTLEGIIETPTDIAIDEDKNTIYAFTTSGETLLGRGILYIINGSTDTTIQGIIIGSNGTDIAFHKTSGKIYITHTFNSTIDGYNTKKDTLLCTITEFFDPTGIAIDPKTNLIYVCETSTGKVAVIKDTNIKTESDNNKPEQPPNNEPESNNNINNINPELLNDFEQSLDELNNIQSEISSSSKFARSVAIRISSAIKKLRKIVGFSQSTCESQLQVGIEKLETIISFFESKICSETKAKRCIPTDTGNSLLTEFEDQIETIRAITENDDNGNNTSDLCERE